MISSALTLDRSSLCSSSDTLSSFLSSVIKLSFSWSTQEQQNHCQYYPKNTIVERQTNELRQKYPSDCVGLRFKGPQDRGVCFLLNVMDLCFHVIVYPRKWTRAHDCWSSISSYSNMIWIMKSIFPLMGRRKIIICSCFILWKLISKMFLHVIIHYTIEMFTRIILISEKIYRSYHYHHVWIQQHNIVLVRVFKKYYCPVFFSVEITFYNIWIIRKLLHMCSIEGFRIYINDTTCKKVKSGDHNQCIRWKLRLAWRWIIPTFQLNNSN